MNNMTQYGGPPGSPPPPGMASSPTGWPSRDILEKTPEVFEIAGFFDSPEKKETVDDFPVEWGEMLFYALENSFQFQKKYYKGLKEKAQAVKEKAAEKKVWEYFLPKRFVKKQQNVQNGAE